MPNACLLPLSPNYLSASKLHLNKWKHLSNKNKMIKVNHLLWISLCNNIIPCCIIMLIERLLMKDHSFIYFLIFFHLFSSYWGWSLSSKVSVFFLYSWILFNQRLALVFQRNSYLSSLALTLKTQPAGISLEKGTVRDNVSHRNCDWQIKNIVLDLF